MNEQIEYLGKLADAATKLEALSALAFKSAHGFGGQAFPKFRAQQLIKARRRLKGAMRLRRRIATVAATIESQTLQTLQPL